MFSNRYVILYAALMVIIVAIALTFVAVLLKPRQENNIRVEKMQNILSSVNIESSTQNAGELYKKYITASFVINNKGQIQKNVNAFDVDLYYELKKPLEDRMLPVYVCDKGNNEKYYIVQLRGKGLWGPIWGYISFRNDYNTIEGAMFGHKGETPGLGAEIDTREFQEQFAGKSIFNENGEFVSIKVKKGGAADDDTHAVDAITGGTITSVGLQDMLSDCLEPYVVFFKAQMKKQ